MSEVSGLLANVPAIVSEIKIPFPDNYKPISYQDNDGQDNGSANKNLLRHRYAAAVRSGSANENSLRHRLGLFAEPERSSRRRQQRSDGGANFYLRSLSEAAAKGGSVAMAEQISICGAIVLSVVVLITDWFIVVRTRYFHFRNDYRYFR